MKGVILAGGLGTRLRPITLVTNKHLLPVYNKPMIYYPIEAMQRAGIKEVLLTTSDEHVEDFSKLLQNGESFDMRLSYALQKNATGGIADALSLAEKFAHGDSILVILGDNIFTYDLKSSLDAFQEKIAKTGKGAMVFGIRLDTKAQHYGVIEIDETGRVISIEEKPKHPKSDIAQTGIYAYDSRVFEFIHTLAPSARGQLEVTDLNTKYLSEGTLMCEIIDWWVDAGTSHDELLRANVQVAQKLQKQ